MDDQALVEGSVVFKDEDDPAEESPVSYQSRTWCLGSCRVTACPKIVAKKTWIKDGAQESSFLPDDGFCPGSKQDFLLAPQERKNNGQETQALLSALGTEELLLLLLALNSEQQGLSTGKAGHQSTLSHMT